MNFEEITIFGKKTFGDLLKEIHSNQNKAEKQISDLIMAMKPLITSPGEAVMIVPLIAQYMEIKVKNDEHLIKMATIVQRAMNSMTTSTDTNDLGLSDSEKEQLMLEVSKMGESQQKITSNEIVKAS